ncbi:MAG: hypothetical protein ACI9DS_003146 [Glaciecola sp.]|jgi:hypothetical protein
MSVEKRQGSLIDTPTITAFYVVLVELILVVKADL